MTAAARVSGFTSTAREQFTGESVDWDTLQHLLRESDPAAAESLYRLYADGLRMVLRRHSGISDVEDNVYIVLLQAARAVRDDHVSTIDGLTRYIREAAQSQIHQLRNAAQQDRAPAIPDARLRQLTDNLSTVMSRLTAPEREVLLRTYMIEQSDREISEQTGMSEPAIRNARSKAKLMFRQLNRQN